MSIPSSIIVCTKNRLKNVLTFLDSVEKQTEPPTELIIIDSSNIPIRMHKKFVKNFSQKRFKQTKLIYSHTNPGLTKQRNIGARLSSTEIIHFLDDDSILDQHYLYEMNKIFEKNSQYAGGMGSIENLPPQVKLYYRFFRKFFLLQRIRASGKFTWSGMPTHPYGTDKFKAVEVLGGCCMAYRRNIVIQTLFDETLTGYAYMEDCDFSRRVSCNYTLFFNPNAKCIHIPSPINRDSIIENRATFIKNYSYLFFKNFYPKNKIKVFCYLWSIFGLCLEAVLYRKFSYLKGYSKGLKFYWW